MVFIAEPLQFLERLKELLQTTNGSIWITYKQYVPGCERKSANEERRKKWLEKKERKKERSGKTQTGGGPSTKHDVAGCLIRATDGKKIKISTLITAKDDLSEFQMALTRVYTENMAIGKSGVDASASGDSKKKRTSSDDDDGSDEQENKEKQRKKKHKMQKD